MLLNKSAITTRDAKLTPKSIEIQFFEDGVHLALELPSAEELASIRDGFRIKLSFPDISKKDILNLREQYQDEINYLLGKYSKYKESSSYLVDLSNLSEMLGKNGEAFGYLVPERKESSKWY